MTQNFDYIIIGSGCAGLSFAYHLAESKLLAHKRVLLLDSDKKTKNDKTWCFWSKNQYPYQSAQKTSWSKLEFKADDLLVQHELNAYKYCHINSLEFYSEVFEKLNALENFVIKTESVSQITEQNSKVFVETEKETYTADFAFNSVMSLLKGALPKPKLFQHFYGKRIKTTAPFFKNAHVKLMDFSLPNKDTVQFGYILPFSDEEALVEYTEFSPNVRSDEGYEALFNTYVAHLGLSDYEVLEHEKGQIPMSDYLFPRFNSSRVLNIGTAGGFTKPTTGYTFKNIQTDVASIVKSLEEGRPFNRGLGPSRFRFYDKILLGIILKHPEKVKPIMEKLFKNNSIELILNFLDEKTQIKDDIKIFLKLPWAPFLKQLFLK